MGHPCPVSSFHRMLSARIGGGAPSCRIRRVDISPTGFLLAGLSGAWIAHNLEYVRVWGSSVFPTAASRSVHVYMGPAGSILLLLALAAVHFSFRAAGHLERRLSRLHRAVAGGPAEGMAEELPVSLQFSWSTLLGLLWLWQLVLYLAQENLEAHSLGLSLPWLGAMSGVHALAPAVHLAVAVTVTSVMWLLHRRITHLTAEIRRVADRLATRRRPAVATVTPRTPRSWTPAERWGVQLWGRPPPVPATT